MGHTGGSAWLGEAKGASSRGKQLPKAAVEMLSKSLECHLEHLLKCFAERGAQQRKKSLGKSQCINTSGVSIIKATALPHDAVSNKWAPELERISAVFQM